MLSSKSVLTSNSSPVFFEKGAKVACGAVKIINLFGTWHEMGRQYGALLKQELSDVSSFAEQYVEKNGETAVKVLLAQWSQISYTIHAFMEGMAQTSGLSLSQLYRANAVERLCGLPECSCAIAWDDYAKDDLIVGRNYDYGESFFAMKNNLVTAVFHPADGSLATAAIGYVGEIYATNAINEKGIFMELNNGSPSAPILPPNDRIIGTTLLLNTMFQAHSLDYFDAFFNTSLCSESYIINVCDTNNAHSYEWCPVGCKKGCQNMPDGLLLSTNHYQNSEWDLAHPTDQTSWLSFLRLNNLRKQCDAEKGMLDPQKMMKIMQTDEDHGGSANALTVYQYVVVPKTMQLWLRIIGAADWTPIDLKSFLLP